MKHLIKCIKFIKNGFFLIKMNNAIQNLYRIKYSSCNSFYSSSKDVNPCGWINIKDIKEDNKTLFPMSNKVVSCNYIDVSPLEK